MRISKGDDTSPVGNNRISGKRYRVSRGRCGISWVRFARISKFRDMWRYSIFCNEMNYSFRNLLMEIYHVKNLEQIVVLVQGQLQLLHHHHRNKRVMVIIIIIIFVVRLLFLMMNAVVQVRKVLEHKQELIINL